MKRLTSDVLALHMLTSGKTGSTPFYRADSLLAGRGTRPTPGTSLASSWADTDLLREN